MDENAPMPFFPPRWAPSEKSAPDPRGWRAYVVGGIAVPDGVTPDRWATNLLVIESPRTRIWISTVDAYPDVLTFEVRCELRDVRGGEALQKLLDRSQPMSDGASPPRSGLVVGLELTDGTRIRTYAAGPDDNPTRLRRRSGGASASPDSPSTMYETYGVELIPDGPFSVVCSFTAVDVHEARALVSPHNGSA